MPTLAQLLKGFKTVSGPQSIQPNLATVEAAEFTHGDVARPIGFMDGKSIHVTRDQLTGPAWGATNAAAFISLSGIPPVAPVIGQIGGIKGSNAPDGGQC